MLQELFYRGPSLAVLHEEYAKRGRIDDRAPVTASGEIRIAAPVERVWALLSAPGGWPAIDPAIRDVHLDAAVAADVPFTWTNGPSRIASRFAVVDAGRELTWTGVSSGARAVHRHLLTPAGAGATRLATEESMAGPLLVIFFNSAKLRAGLDRWLAALAAAAEGR